MTDMARPCCATALPSSKADSPPLRHRATLCQGGTVSCSWHHLVSQTQANKQMYKWDLGVVVVGIFNSCCKILGPQLLPTYFLNVLIHCSDSVMKALYSITMEGKCFLMNTGNAVGTREEQPEFVTLR